MHTISNSILKISKDIISNSLSDIFNESLSQQIFLDDFKIARVTPIHKGVERYDVGNYRPISIFHSSTCIRKNNLHTVV